VAKALRAKSQNVRCIRFIGTLGNGSNLMSVFFELVLMGNNEEKVEYFKELVDSNKKLERLVIDKDGRIEEYNDILDFIDKMTNEEV
jgi:hypothetical protein